MARRWTRCALAFAAAVATLALASPASAVAPANDQVAGAFTIPDGPYQVLSTLVPDITDATTTGDPPLPSCQTSVSRSVWYKWTPGRTSSYRISTAQDRGTGSTLPDTVLAIYTSTGGNAGPFTQVPGANGCDDDSATTLALQSTLSGTFNAGTTYYLVVSKFGSTAPTAGAAAVQVSINDLTPAPPPPPPPPPPPANNTTTPTQTGAVTDTVASSVSGFSFGNTTLRAASKGGSIARKKPPVGTRVRYRVSEAGSARFTVERRARGRKKGKRCVAPTKKNRTAKRCTRYVKLKGSFSRVSKVGLNSFRFTGRLRGKKLRPGRYRLVMVATDIAKNKSKPKRAKFRVVRG